MPPSDDGTHDWYKIKRDIAAYIAYTLKKEEPSQIDVYVGKVANNFWLQFCSEIRLTCFYEGGYFDGFVKACVQDVLHDMKLKDEDFQSLWLSTSNGESWLKPGRDPDELIPWDLNNIIEDIYYKIYNLATDCDDPDLLAILDEFG